MDNKGWIKIERSIIDHWIFQDAEYLRAWMMILILANHKDVVTLVNKIPTLVPRGSFHSSLTKLATLLGWDKRTLVRFLAHLETEQMLTTTRTTNGTTFFVVNYGKYQGDGTTECTTDGTAHGTAHSTADGTAYGTADGTADGTETRMIKNGKNGKNEKNNARAREESARYLNTSFRNFEERHTDYEALFGGDL